MTALITLIATISVIALAVTYERLLSTRTQLNRSDQERDNAQWRALTAEDKIRRLEVNLKSLAGKYAVRGAEIEALKLELWKLPRPDAQVLRDTARRLQPVRLPTDADLERGVW